MKDHKQSLGKWGEELAESYLCELGYTILDRNARTPYGEIDLIACHGEPQESPRTTEDSNTSPVTVFVEVKTRSSRTYGYPEQAITARKRAHLLASAQAYLQAHPEIDGDWRIDVVSIERSACSSQPMIMHFENAVVGAE